MHELSIALSVVDGALEELRARGAAEAGAIYLRVGRLSGVDKDALLFSYSIAIEETPLARSHLVIEDVEVVILCASCQAERTVRSFPGLACAECGALAERVVRGNELEIAAMELLQ